MARRGPRLIDSHLDFAAGRLDYVVERPAEEGLPEVIWILDDSLQSTTSSGEAQDTDTQRISEGEYGEYFSPLSRSPSFHEAPYADDGEQEGEYPPYLPVDDEEVSEDTDNSSDWNDSEEWGDWSSGDSGYDTMDERDDSPLIREHPPEPFWHNWQHAIAPGAAPIAMPPFGQANAPLFPRIVAPVGDPPAAPPSAVPSAAPSSPALSSASSAVPSAASSSAALSSASSAVPSAASSSAALSSASSAVPSAASSSAALSSASSAAPSAALSAAPSSEKRSRDDMCTEEVSAKRCKVSDQFDAPSTSSGSFGVRRFWERPFNLLLDDSDSD
ncbi:unnamed protein product [Oreochromis niloticus]|nr:unnamed protein product [Mustela putorius furo]